MDDKEGTVLEGKYRLGRLIGKGGMGSVYEAEHTALDRRVAIKVMHPEFAAERDVIDRFFREAKAASSIGHPNIIEIKDVVKDSDNTVFIVMELLKGRNLSALLNESRRLQPGLVVSIILQVLSPLNATHKKGIIHRDLKPDNVFLAVNEMKREEVKLLDFGIARIQGAAEMGLTKPGRFLGTPFFLSPEQASAIKDIDARVDIWAVGVMMYQMLSGHLPYEGDSFNEIVSKILSSEPKPLQDLVPEVPDGLAAVVHSALVKDRDERYRNAAEMLGDLFPFQELAKDLMSIPSIQALRNSSLQTPFFPVSDSTPQSGSDLQNDITTRDVGVPSVPKPMDPRAKKAMWIVVAVIAYAGLIAAILSSRLGYDEEMYYSRPPARQLAQPQGPPRAPASPAQPTVPENVTIDATGLPPDAAVTIDGKEVELPTTLKRSAKPLILKVSGKGYVPFEQALVPDRDQKIEVVMKRNDASEPQ